MDSSVEAQENLATDLAVKQAATRERHLEAWVLVASLLKIPQYSEAELKWAKTEGATG